MKPLNERLEPIEIEEPVHIPTPDGERIAETVHVKVPAWRDPSDGEIYLDEKAQQILDRAKARHMGLLSSRHIKELRESNRLTQSEVAQLFQMGQKTWTRWESGRERPSRSMNILLRAFADGKINVDYLKSLQDSPAAPTAAAAAAAAADESRDDASLVWDSVRSLHFGSFASARLSKAIESQTSHSVEAILQIMRSYGRTAAVGSQTAAIMLYRNAFLQESPNRLVDLRAYGGRTNIIERKPEDEEVAA